MSTHTSTGTSRPKRCAEKGRGCWLVDVHTLQACATNQQAARAGSRGFQPVCTYFRTLLGPRAIPTKSLKCEYTKNVSATPLESALSLFLVLKYCRISTYAKNGGRGVPPPCRPLATAGRLRLAARLDYLHGFVALASRRRISPANSKLSRKSASGPLGLLARGGSAGLASASVQDTRLGQQHEPARACGDEVVPVALGDRLRRRQLQVLEIAIRAVL
jgi:hypothetical protein